MAARPRRAKSLIFCEIMSRLVSHLSGKDGVVLVDGVRVPFMRQMGAYKDMLTYNLGRLAVKGLIAKTAIEPSAVDYVTFGTVAQEIRTHNIAREVAIGAGLPMTTAAHTVSQACISSNQAISTGVEKILAGTADVVVAGGSETFSDAPIRFSRKVRQKLIASQKHKGALAKIGGIVKGLSLSDLAPETPAIKNFATDETMGASSDRLASKWGVSRVEQDAFTIRSHANAAKATADGRLKQEIVAVDGNDEDDTIQTTLKPKYATMEAQYAALNPAFIRPHGTHTAANSSGFADGAAACLVTSAEKARHLGLAPKARIRGWNFVATDPFEEMLLGPAYAVQRLLAEHSLAVEDIDVWEIHEAFAGQILANINALGSDQFGVGAVPMEKLNTLGGSLSLGHPFGATGARLTTTAANRLNDEDGRFAVLSACADSGLATAMLLERFE